MAKMPAAKATKTKRIWLYTSKMSMNTLRKIHYFFCKILCTFILKYWNKNNKLKYLPLAWTCWERGYRRCWAWFTWRSSVSFPSFDSINLYSVVYVNYFTWYPLLNYKQRPCSSNFALIELLMRSSQGTGWLFWLSCIYSHSLQSYCDTEYKFLY